MNVLTEFARPDRLGAALDKFQAFREAVLPGTREARGRESRRYGWFSTTERHTATRTPKVASR